VAGARDDHELGVGQRRRQALAERDELRVAGAGENRGRHGQGRQALPQRGHRAGAHAAQDGG
jgi:hypothetical protein